MPIFLLFIVLKLAITLLIAIVGAMFAAELLPQLGHWAVMVSEGTMFAPFAEIFAQGLNFLAHLAGQFLTIVYHFLQALGIDATSLKSAAEGAKSGLGDAAGGGGAGPAVNAPPSSDKPGF